MDSAPNHQRRVACPRIQVHIDASLAFVQLPYTVCVLVRFMRSLEGPARETERHPECLIHPA
jgi:hypothetical protein